MAVYGYVRVSTAAQVEDGESLDVQRRQVEGYAQVIGAALDHVFVERGVSGSRPMAERPEGAGLLAALRRDDVVIAAKLDRMFRSALDALRVGEELRRRGVHLHLIDLGGDITNGMGKAFFTIAAAFAEAERDRIRERITDVKCDQRRRGRYLGGTVPFGYRVGPAGGLVEVPEQQAAIRRAVELRDAGLSLRAIAEAMRGDGFDASHMLVRRILRDQQAAA